MNHPVVIEHQSISGALTAAEMRFQVQRIQEVMKELMKPDVHYGYIPGTEPKNDEEKKHRKPSLLKAGAEKLCLTFRFGTDYEIVEKEHDGEHLTITSKCILTHIPTSQKIGSALGSCSTMESKYAYRKAARTCPKCRAEAIIKGKDEYGGGWLCFRNKGGCGAKFKDGDESIEGQQVGKVPNEDKADQYNTVLKMANKRALLAAVLNATAASDIFSQDLLDDNEDGPPTLTPAGEDAMGEAARPKPVAQPQAKTSASAKINAGQVNFITKKVYKAGTTPEAICAEFKVASLADIPQSGVNAVLLWIESQAG